MSNLVVVGLELQKGARRHSFVLGLRDRGWNVVAVDSGNQYDDLVTARTQV